MTPTPIFNKIQDLQTVELQKEKTHTIERQPSLLDNLQASLAPEIAAMNNIISESLRTDHPVVNQIVEGYLATKGKQIRPILVMLSAKMFGDINHDVLVAGAWLELLHNATLIHDDVVDDTTIRRGHPTLNAIWGNHIAVLAGDLMVSKALSLGVETGQVSTLSTLSSLGTELSLGEMDQLFNARGHNLDEQSYINMIERKTASLFKGCVKIGAEAAGATKEEYEPLRKYARLLGLAFQIRDDIFDYFPSEKTGKPSGNDLLEGKVTLPLIYALNHGPKDQAEEMRNILLKDGGLTKDEVEVLQEFARKNGGIEYAVEKMRQFQKEGIEIMKCYPDSECKQNFLDIFEFIIARSH